MFVSINKYKELLARYEAIINQYQFLLKNWNDLIDKINEKGGDEFLNGNNLCYSLKKDDIKKLILLCHPDRHEGKAVSTEMTQKLIQIRDSM